MKVQTNFLKGKRGIILLILIIGIMGSNSWKSSRKQFTQDYKIVSPPIPEKLFFSGERVPLENWDVRERFERELIINTYYHSSTLLYLKRAHRWFPVIERILRKFGVPRDFKYMAVAESGLENVVSDAGATGFWQLMKGAARKYGLEVNKEVDERYNVEKATEAACKYLKDAKRKYGSWTLAAASYNLGTNGIDKQIQREKTHNYYNLVLNDETSRFVFRILAIKQVMTHPKLYGFDVKPKDLYPPLKYFVVKVRGRVKHWADFAFRYGYNYRILKIFNPWLRENYLKNRKRKTYYIKLPVKGSIKVIKG
jgi:hypothetical protein